MVAISSLDIGDDLAKYVEDSLPWAFRSISTADVPEQGG